jgi:hypothetical protein
MKHHKCDVIMVNGVGCDKKAVFFCEDMAFRDQFVLRCKEYSSLLFRDVLLKRITRGEYEIYLILKS